MDILKKYIKELINIRKELDILDKRNLWNYKTLPKKGITYNQINLFEDKMKKTFPIEYKHLLTLLNGWDFFWQDISLFSIDDYNDEKLMKYTWDILNVIDTENVEKLFPIGIDKNNIDLIVIVEAGYKDEGNVIWFAGYEIERYENLAKFFKGMGDLLKEDVIDFKNGIY